MSLSPGADLPPVQPAGNAPAEADPTLQDSSPATPAPWVPSGIPFSAGPPEPPPGPGVRVPFAAPPTERDRRRTWIGLGVGGAVLLLCCVGGVLGIGALVVSTDQALPTEARTAVSDFLDGLATGDYGKAYDQLCDRVQSAESQDDFRLQQRQLSAVRSYTVEPAVRQGNDFQVSAEVGNSTGQTSTEVYTVQPDSQAGALRVCAGPRVI